MKNHNVKSESGERMIEVVFSESTKGSIKVAKKYNKEDMQKRPFAFIGNPLSKEKFEIMFEGEPLGGSSNDVIGICFNLDIGSISDVVINENRKELIFEMLKSPIGIDNKQEEKSKEYWEDNIISLSRLKKCAQKGEHIRIWYSDAPYSLCGFHFVISILKEFQNMVSTVKLPEYQIQGNKTIVSYSTWGEISPEKFYRFLKFEKEISQIEKYYFAGKWSELQRENSYIRAVVNGKLVSVNEEFYDYYIRINIPDSEFRMSQLIGEVLGKYLLGIGDWWIAQRIKNMIASKELLIISENDFDYNMVLKRNRNFL